MKTSLLLGLGMLVSSASYASNMRELSSQELSTLNWLLQCPSELNELNQGGQWVGSAKFFSDRIGSRTSYRFFRRVGFTETEYVATLHVSRITREHPPADAPNFKVTCEIRHENQ